MAISKSPARRRIQWALTSALFVAAYGACTDEPGSQQAATTETPMATIQVVLTEPFCDVCTSAEKRFLHDRSPIMHEVLGLIKGARHTLDVAQYTFSRKSIRDAIIQANNDGVRVRVAMDVGQERASYSTRSKELRDAGVDVHFISAQPGLMHAKFMVVDGDTVLTGSNNFSSTGVSINEENTIILRGARDPRVVGLKCHFEAIYADAPDAAGACSNDVAAFSPSSKGRNLVRSQLRAAKTSIDVIMHHLKPDILLGELIAAARKGIEVRLLVNAEDTVEYSHRKFADFVQAGGQIRFKKHNTEASQLLHHKLAIIDGHTLVNGSGNWSAGGFFRNHENFILYREPHVLARFREMYQRLWTWSLSKTSLDQGISAAEQHRRETRHYFGNLHAHFAVQEAGRDLDDGKPFILDEEGQEQARHIPYGVAAAAKHTFDYARQNGGLDFIALTPHSREESEEDDTNANMSREGYQLLRQAATESSSGAFLALAGMEWSSNSTGNHIGVLGASEVSKVKRGRYDLMYNEFLVRQARAGERPFVTLNHPKTFRTQEVSLDGSWDMIFGVNLLEIPKAGQRRKKFNDYGIDDFGPMPEVLPSWIDGSAMPDPATVEAGWKAMLYAAGDHIRMMEVTLNRGNEFGQESARNPSEVPSLLDAEVMSRRTKVHSDYDYFLTRGFRIAPVASHDNHYANWGTGHTSRTVAIATSLKQRAFLDAIEFRQIYASEDENLQVQLYAEGRDPMGSIHRTMRDRVRATVHLRDPDYDGTYTIRVFQGRVGHDGVVARQEFSELAAGSHNLSISVPEDGLQFFYLEIFEEHANRMAWTAPLWIDHLSDSYSDPTYPHGSGRLTSEGEDPGDGDGGGGGGGGDGEDHGDDPKGRIVINEVDYDQPQTDTAEFVELLNTSDKAIDLSDLVLVGLNGRSSTEYMRVDLSAAGATLKSGQYLVIGSAAALAGVPETELSIVLPASKNILQNGAPDALGIFNLAQGELIDALSYEGELTDGEVNGFGAFNFVEGTATQLVDSSTTMLSLCRSPNGSDSDDAASDWASALPSPGRANP